MQNLTYSQAIAGFTLYKTATGIKPTTIATYRNSFSKLQHYLNDQDPLFHSITRSILIQFFAWLQTEYISDPDGVAPRGPIRLSAKSIYNIHTNLSSLWTWAVNEGIIPKNLIRTIDPPEYHDPEIKPLTQDEIKALLKACARSRSWKTRPHTTHTRPTADRDRAIILVLLDTGIRASELCHIQIADLNLSDNSIHILGKRDKWRYVHIGTRTARAIWRHLTPRLPLDDHDLLFTVGPIRVPRPLTRDVLRLHLKRIGNRAGVSDVYTHRFRHTFAITYLRNQGDVFTLQHLLGHSTLTMVRRYLHIVRTDCADAHRRASPVDNWKL